MGLLWFVLLSFFGGGRRISSGIFLFQEVEGKLPADYGLKKEQCERVGHPETLFQFSPENSVLMCNPAQKP